MMNQEATMSGIKAVHTQECEDLIEGKYRTLPPLFNQVVDQCGINQESLSITLSYLDYFLMTSAGITSLYDIKTFRLAATTLLYIAIKVFEPKIIDPEFVAMLSHGTYSENDVTKMEMIILYVLDWRIQPPTAMTFTRHFLDLVELTVSDYNFVEVKKSVIATASILNTLDMAESNPLPDSFLCSLILTPRQHGSISLFGNGMREVRDRLLSTVSNHPTFKDQRITTCASSILSTLKTVTKRENVST
eukprot:5541312-Ditylum_brightwellii.AAC.1